MARLMADSDLAIGAAGGTAWERCCLGVPALVVVLAQNQRAGAQALAASGAALLVGEGDSIPTAMPPVLAAAARPEALIDMSRKASSIVDGRGVERATQAMGAGLE
jgi:spore coat polysaccharide biosynthesis predicted glycosyltransferase SpsG